MSLVEEILKDMKTPEGKAKLKKLAEEFVKKQKENDKISKDLVSNTNYIEWLIKFTQDKEGFCNDDWLYFPEKLNEADRSNVYIFHLFFHGVENYAQANRIYPKPCDFGGFYKIRFNEIGFEIGMLVGQGTVFFCNKVAVKNEKEFIDFNNIMNNKKQKGVNEINEVLNYLYDVILSADENGVPIQSIINTCDSTIREIISKKEDKEKALEQPPQLVKKPNNNK